LSKAAVFRIVEYVIDQEVLPVKKQISLLTIFLLTAGLLSGCFSESPEEKISSILEESVKKEKVFEEQQTPITDSEKKEKELYGKIIGLSMKEFDQIVALSDDALQNLADREKLINKERKSIEESQKQFSKMNDVIKDIDDKDIQKKARALQDTMEKRFAAHKELYQSYNQSLAKDKELYQLFKKKDLKMEELQTQIDSINSAYEDVIKANEKFNVATQKYNKEKKNFYESTDLKVAGNK
jgi:hypothetical protein